MNKSSLITMANSSGSISKNIDSVYQIFSIMKKVTITFVKNLKMKFIGSFRKSKNIF